MSTSTQQSSISNSYRLDLDIIKAFAIIAVVFYHIGWLDTGYLGVDVFFAINGFLIIPALIKQISENTFKYHTFLLKRIMRLWPLVLLAGTVCLVIGYFCMLPDDYENLSQSVIASDFFSQNILSAITTKDYWDSSNEYKPLMHFWYVGILVELYVILPLVLKFVKSLTTTLRLNFAKTAFVILLVLFVLSFVLYLSPDVAAGDRFYYLPYRLWELVAGGLVGMSFNKEKRTSSNNTLGIVSIVGILLILCSSLYLPYTQSNINIVSGVVTNLMLVPQALLLILAVLFTCVILVNPIEIRRTKIFNAFSLVGKMSFSIFVWHQVLLAFYRYVYGNDMMAIPVIGLWVVTTMLSVVTYYAIEQKIQPNWKSFGVCGIFLGMICISAGLIYIKAGVVRDIPELGVYVENSQRGQFAKYCDRIYDYNQDFPQNDKKNVLVAGVSFGRDFANVLLESEYSEDMNLSYIFVHDEKYANRYSECDYLFTFTNKKDLPSYVLDNLNPNAKVYGLGTKNYGECNGVIYNNRNRANYFDQTVSINPNFYIVNEEWKNAWGNEWYIDFLELSSTENGEIRIFTDDNKFISQDCRHLTQDGAKWYAKIINWSEIF